MTTTSVLRMVMEVAIFMFKYLIVERLGFMIQIRDLARGQKKRQMTFANIDMLQSIVLSDYQMTSFISVNLYIAVFTNIESHQARLLHYSIWTCYNISIFLFMNDIVNRSRYLRLIITSTCVHFDKPQPLKRWSSFVI